MSAKVTPKKTVRTNKGRNGGRLKVGNPGNKGGTGRPSLAWEQRQQAIADIASGKAFDIADDPLHPRWEFVYRTAAEHGYGRPTQPIDVSGKVTVVWDL